MAYIRSILYACRPRSIPISNPSLPPPTCAEPCGKMCADHPGEYFCSARQVFVDTDERKLEPAQGMEGRYVHARYQASKFAKFGVENKIFLHEISHSATDHNSPGGQFN